MRRASRVARPAALAILYPKVGNVLRVPLRRLRISGSQGCAQHPERQFIRWFNRMAAARPGFPMQVKSILLLTGEPLCDSCRRALARYLGQYQLADKLRVRSRGEAAECGCGGSCNGGVPRPPSRQANTIVSLDSILLENELEGEGWWQRAKDLGKAALLTGALVLGPRVVPKPVYDMAKAAAQADGKRRKMQQTVDDNAPPSSRRPGPQQEIGNIPGVPGTTPKMPTTQAGAPSGAGSSPSVINPFIDVFAQYAIQRMLKSPDPLARADGAQMLAAPEAGLLWGIYKEDELEPAQWARKHNTNWWQLLGPGEDAVVVLTESPFNPAAMLPPMLVFRDSIRSNAARLDPALRKAWAMARVALLLKAMAPQLTLEQLRAMVLGVPISLGSAQTLTRVQQGLQQQFAAETSSSSLLTSAQKARNCSCGASLQCLKLRWFCLCLSGSIKPPSFQLKLCSYA